ncbi:MAG: DUF3606 domain-containing protein [Methylococcales bacterium]|nr:DUF3606 domain-containing protein [Methylococcales bacterium]
MADNKRKKKLDATTIALGQRYEVKYRTKTLGVTQRQLTDAVKSVGKSAAKVKKRLKK